MSIDPGTELVSEIPSAFQAEVEGKAKLEPGLGPWRLAVRRLRRNKTALAFLGLFLVIVAMCLAAPFWSSEIAKISASRNNLTGTVTVDGKKRDIVTPEGIPIGPTWQSHYFLGADENGRDVMVRLLYGGRNSLVIGFAAAFITVVLSVMFGVLAGFYRGATDSVISWLMDVLWSFPVILLGVAIGVAAAIGGLNLWIIKIDSGSLMIPIIIIGVVYVPYMARPIRGQVLALREKEFVEAARSQGAGSLRIMASELMPNLASTIVVFLPLIVANAILLESALSFLGAGVQPPETSWGTMIDDGVGLIATAPHLTIVPGLMLVACVLALNIFGDGVRDALDPRAKIRLDG